MEKCFRTLHLLIGKLYTSLLVKYNNHDVQLALNMILWRGVTGSGGEWRGVAATFRAALRSTTDTPISEMSGAAVEAAGRCGRLAWHEDSGRSYESLGPSSGFTNFNTADKQAFMAFCFSSPCQPVMQCTIYMVQSTVILSILL